ncbi:TPA: hypothetical protein EYP70_02280 [Candidatus Bathyarchaeota archaeon]|nr:hypothetical protein [Candidatus Bathyarchaeota archaeon]
MNEIPKSNKFKFLEWSTLRPDDVRKDIRRYSEESFAAVMGNIEGDPLPALQYKTTVRHGRLFLRRRRGLQADGILPQKGSKSFGV